MIDISAVSLPQTKLSRFVFGDVRMSWVWLLVRMYVGWQWIEAGWAKLQNPLWVGSQAGTAIKGFLLGALQKTGGPHPDVQDWYASFIDGFVLHHTVLFSYLVSYGELLVGVALVLGLFTGIAAFFGAFMNMNYLLAGTVSINPILLVLEVFLMLAWRIGGWIGLDRYVLSRIYSKKE